jgi:hypothetical protein
MSIFQPNRTAAEKQKIVAHKKAGGLQSVAQFRNKLTGKIFFVRAKAARMARVERRVTEWGLSTVHISPAKVEVRAGGGVLRVIAEHVPHLTIPDRRRRAKRGAVRGFSKSSRRRLLFMVHAVLRSVLPLFATLTYPDVYSEDPEVWKRDFDVWAKRVHRRFPKVSIVWRLELKRRKSGTNVGELAPHFHALLYGLGWPAAGTLREKLMLWVSMSWYEVVGSENAAHLAAGTRVEEIHSMKHLTAYVCKYLAKVDQSEDVEVGRWWGVRYRDNMPWAPLLTFSCSRSFAYSLIRAMRRHMNLSRVMAWRSLRCLCDASQWAEKFGLSPPAILRVVESVGVGRAG